MTESSTPHKERNNDQFIYGLLREIRAAAHYLLKRVEETLDQASNLNGVSRTEVMTRILDQGMLTRIDGTIKANLESIRQLFRDDVSQYDWCSDDVQMIRLNWLEVHDLWPQANAAFDEQSRRLSKAKTCLDQIIFRCAQLTLTSRVTDILRNLRVGQPLDWGFRFDDELPHDKELRKELLKEFAQEGGVLKTGVVDVDEMVIYRIAGSRVKQRRSTWNLALFVVLCGIFVPSILFEIATLRNGWPLRWADLPWGDLPRIYMTYVLVFLGAGAHVAIDSLKEARAQTRPNFQAMNDWILWLHVHYTSILSSLAWVLLGYILLSFAMPKLELPSAFFAGYSIDSITTLFLTRFETTVKTKTQELTGDKSKL